MGHNVSAVYHFCEKKSNIMLGIKGAKLRLMVDCIALFEYSPVHILLP